MGSGIPLLRVAGRLIRLAIPVSLGRVGVVGMGIADTIVVGQIAPHQLAQQSLGWTINGPAVIGGMSLLLGVQVLAARAVGAGKPQMAGTIWRNGLVIAAVAGMLICGLVWTAASSLYAVFGISPDLVQPAAAVARVLSLSVPAHLAFIASTNFLEALKRPTPGAAAMWAANAVNLVLDLVLVPRWGAMGSAWATVLSRFFLLGVIAVYILANRDLKPYLSRAPGRVGFYALLAIGAAAAVSSTVEAGTFATLSVIAARIDAPSVAAFSIAMGGLLTLVYMIALGLSTAGTVLVSEAVGRGVPDDGSRIGWTAVAMTVLCMATCGSLSVVFAPQVARGFTADPATIAALVGVMGLVGLLMIPDGGQGVTDAILRARGDNWFPTVVRMLAFVLVAPPLAFWLAEHNHQGLFGVVEALLMASFLAFGAQAARLFFLKAGPPAR